MNHLINSWHALIALLSLLALGFCLAMGTVRYQTGKRRRYTLANTAPSLNVSPYDPNSSTHQGGRLGNYVADAAISVRWSLVKIGASPGKSVAANTASSTPFGIVGDTTDTLGSDLTIGLVVETFSSDRTMKVAVNTAVAVGDWLIPDTSNPIYGMTDPGVNLNRFGRALTATSGAGVVEFAPCMPTRTAAGSFTSAGSVTTDAIAITGLLATDFVSASLAVQAGSEVLKTAKAAAGQINLVYSANSGATTTVNYTVTRP